MTHQEMNALASLERRLFGSDGEGGAIGGLRADMQTVRSDVDEIKGGVKVALWLVGLIGAGGIVTMVANLLSAIKAS